METNPRKILLPLIPLFFVTSAAFPFALLPKEGPPQVPSEIMFTMHDANEVLLGLMSSGPIGLDPFTWSPVGFWPKDTDNNYVYGSGFWVGGIADIDGDGEEEQFGVQSFGYSAQTEFAPGRVTDDPLDPLSRLYVNTIPQDLLEWPVEFKDQSGNPLVHSLQDIVGIYNDVNGTSVYALGPVGIQVEQRSMAFASGRTSQAIIVVWAMTNISGDLPQGPYTIEDAYVAVDSDMDIGDEFSDDRTGFFTYQITEEGDSIPAMLAFAWDNDFNEQNFEGIPGFVGVKYLLSPGNDTDGIDNDRDGLVDESPYNNIDDDSDGETDEWGEVDELGLVNYTFLEGMSGTMRPYPESDEELYRVMSCNPPQECVETTEPRDTRFLMSSGPFDWPPGRTVRVAIAFVFALPVGEPTHIDVYGDPPRPDPNDPVFADFLAVAMETQGFFDAGFPDTLTELLVYSTTRFPDTVDLTGPYEVFTNAVSSAGVSRVTLFFSLDGGSTYLTKEMTHLAGNAYNAAIEGIGRGGGEIEYFVQAVDSSFRVEREPESAPAVVFDFRVLYIPGFFPADSVSGIAPVTPGSSSDLQWGDYDSDGDLDLYVTIANPGGSARLYRNDGGRAFTDVTEESGAGLPGEFRGETAFGDYDNDGDLDIVVMSLPSHPLLLKNLGDGTFGEVSLEAGLDDTLYARKPVWMDADGDGFLDLAAAGVERMFLYANRGGSRFEEEALKRGFPPEKLGQNGLLPFDADGDGDSDLLLMSEASRFFRNNDGYFVDASGFSGLGFGIDAAAPVNIDGDMDLDLFIASSNTLRVFRNDGMGSFSEASDVYDLSGIGGERILIGDANIDGLPDLFLPSGIYITDEDGDVASTRAVNDLSPVETFSDANSDGLLDVFTAGLHLCSGFMSGIANNWLEVDLEGTLSNRSAIGATATLIAGERVISGVVPGASPLPLRLHFGFEEEEPESLVIRWPSGALQIERNPPANALIRVVEDSTLSGIGGREPSGKMPAVYFLHQNYPNPFNPETTIGFDIPEAAEEGVQVRLSVYSLRGVLVRKLVDAVKAPGSYSVTWDGRDGEGLPAGSGVYFTRLEAGEFSSVRKIVLLR